MRQNGCMVPTLHSDGHKLISRPPSRPPLGSTLSYDVQLANQAGILEKGYE